MSCGKPHDVDCGEILDRVYLYLDNEISARDCAEVRHHLDECAPCLRQYGLEQVVKALVARSCGYDPTPADLRAKVLARIRTLRIEVTTTE
jgi:mycothiol system anti-sigma-R factor